jgi:putative membrane protein
VINAGMVLLCSKLVEGFTIDSFGTAFIFSILLSVSQWILYQFIKD